MSGSSDRALVAGLAVLTVALYAHAHQVHGVDDAYISFRYARNLADGHGAVYNPGERVYGSTAMAWVALLGGASRALRVPVEHVASLLNALLLVANVWLLYALLARATPSRVLRCCGVALLVLAPRFLSVVALGMETALYTALILATFLACVTGRPLLAGIVAGLTFCTRPDGLAAVAAAAVCLALEGLTTTAQRRAGAAAASPVAAGRRLLWLAAGFALVAVPFVVAMWLYYGAVLPNTLGAKRTHPLVSGRWWMLQHFWPGAGWPVAAAAALLGFAGAVRVLGRQRRRQPLTWHAGHRLVAVASAWLAIYVAAWVAVRIDFYPWYIGAMAPASAILLVALWMPWWHRTNVALRVVPVLALAWVVHGWGSAGLIELSWWHVYSQQIEWPRHRLGEAIARFTQEGKEVLDTGAIGIVGYFAAGTHVVDRAGLVTPLATLAAGTHRTPTLEVHYWRLDESPPHRRILYMASTPWTDERAVDLVLVGVQDRSTFDATRVMPRLPGEGRLGPARYRGLNPIRMVAPPGETIQFEPVWTVEEALDDGAGIRYRLGPDDRPATVLETQGFFRNRVPYADAEVGRTFVDTVTMAVPTDLPPGQYDLTAAGTGAMAATSQVHLGTIHVAR